MRRYYTKWSDRRTAHGIAKPLLYLFIETVALAMLCWLVSLFNILILTLLAVLGAVYFLMTSSLPRYRWAKKRQKYSEY